MLFVFLFTCILFLVLSFSYRLLADQPNFVFQVRGPMQFKNVPEPMMCYFLMENTGKKEYLHIEVPEEISYDFMQSAMGGTTTPPMTPFVFPQRTLGTPAHSPMKQFTSFPFTPEVNVINPTPSHTPTHTPDSSPPGIQKFAHQMNKAPPLSCPFSGSDRNKTEQVRKTSLESAGSINTESASLTQSGSDWSLCNEDGPTSSGFGSVEQSPHILISKEDTNVGNSDVKMLNHTHSIMYPVPEEGLPIIEKSQSDSQLLRMENDENCILRQRRSPSCERSDRSVSLPSCERSDRSVSLPSDDSFDDDSSTPASPSHSNVKFVRHRTSSLKDRVSFFESTTKNRRSGLSTTSYLHNNKSSFDEDSTGSS